MDVDSSTVNPMAESGMRVVDGVSDENEQQPASATGTRRGFGVIPQGYVEPVDVAFLNQIRRVIGSYPPSLGSTPLQRALPFVGGLLTLMGMIGMASQGIPEGYNLWGRTGYHAERVPVLVITEATDEPPLRVQIGLPKCELCGNSADVAVQLAAESVVNAQQGPGSNANAPKGRNDESGARYVWNGPYVDADFVNDEGNYDRGLATAKRLNRKGVGVGATYAYRWRDVRLRKDHNFLNASVLLEAFAVDDDGQKDVSDRYENRFLDLPLEVTIFGELVVDSQQLLGPTAALYPLRRRARQRTAAEVKWQVPPNLHRMPKEQSACTDAICVLTPDLSPILRELVSQEGWSEDSPVTLFVTMQGQVGMRPLVMLHDMTLWRLSAGPAVSLMISAAAGFLALVQVDFVMGIFDVSDVLEKKIRRWLIGSLIPVAPPFVVIWVYTVFNVNFSVSTPMRALGFPVLCANGYLHLSIFLTTAQHTVARVIETRAQVQDAKFFNQELRHQCAAIDQLNSDLREVTDGPVFKLMFPWAVGLGALAYNNFAKLFADSKQPFEWNVLGFFIAVGLLTSLLLVPARVTTECTKLVSDVNRRLLVVETESEKSDLAHLQNFISTLNDGSGIGFFLLGVRISEEIVKSVVSGVVTLALAFATSAG